MHKALDNFRLYAGVVKRVGYTLTAGMLTSRSRDELLKLYNACNGHQQSGNSTPVDPLLFPKPMFSNFSVTTTPFMKAFTNVASDTRRSSN